MSSDYRQHQQQSSSSSSSGAAVALSPNRGGQGGGNGGLPSDFLTIVPTTQQQEQQRQYYAQHDGRAGTQQQQQQYPQQPHHQQQQQQQQQRHQYQSQPLHHQQPPHQRFGMLTIYLKDAQLVKNYGMTRMDPYCEIRMGDRICRSNTAYNGGKHPEWNHLINFQLHQDVNLLQIGVFDECITSDKSIASAVIDLEEVFESGVVDRSFDLSGKQGHEGLINLRIQFLPNAVMPQSTVIYGGGMYSSPSVEIAIPAFPPQQRMGYAPPQQVPPQNQQAQQAAAAATRAQVKELRDMFPSLDEEVILSILASNNYNTDKTVTMLLEMNEAHTEESLT